VTGTFHDFPDAEGVAVACLIAGGLSAMTVLDASPSWPVVTVTRIGGSTNEFERPRYIAGVVITLR